MSLPSTTLRTWVTCSIVAFAVLGLLTPWLWGTPQKSDDHLTALNEGFRWLLPVLAAATFVVMGQLGHRFGQIEKKPFGYALSDCLVGLGIWGCTFAPWAASCSLVLWFTLGDTSPYPEGLVFWMVPVLWATLAFILHVFVCLVIWVSGKVDDHIGQSRR